LPIRATQIEESSAIAVDDYGSEMVAKNVTKGRAERREKHANPHFRHGQVYHNKVCGLIES
jgi:hypothetical protein